MKPKRHTADTLFTVLLLLSFALFALLLSATGAAVYQNSTSHLEENYTSRTAVAYVTEQIHQHDQAGCITFSEVEDIPALCLRETIEQQEFVTYIYYFDGALRELFLRADTIPCAANGTEIVPLASFTLKEVSDADGLLFEITACSENEQSLSAVIRPTCQTFQ